MNYTQALLNGHIPFFRLLWRELLFGNIFFGLMLMHWLSSIIPQSFLIIALLMVRMIIFYGMFQSLKQASRWSYLIQLIIWLYAFVASAVALASMLYLMIYTPIAQHQTFLAQVSEQHGAE